MANNAVADRVLTSGIQSAVVVGTACGKYILWLHPRTYIFSFLFIFFFFFFSILVDNFRIVHFCKPASNFCG